MPYGDMPNHYPTRFGNEASYTSQADIARPQSAIYRIAYWLPGVANQLGDIDITDSTPATDQRGLSDSASAMLRQGTPPPKQTPTSHASETQPNSTEQHT